ncbi:MAG TPA: Ig-like domain-containing protein [Gemmatimonadaceae bacterium]|nr:Ig-like domain-containing protein [Gemmatimonadaceae bacterium]
MRLLHKSYVKALSAAVAFVVFNSACSSTEPRLPKSIEVVGTLTTGTAGLPLATAPTFTVRDASGAVMGDVPVTITVTSGGGTLTGSPTTTASGGPTSIGTLTLGKIAGPNVITVTVGNLEPLIITVVGVAGPPASIAIVAGNNQSVVGGAQLPAPLVAQVRDQFGNGVAGATVAFNVTSGGGTVSPATATTDASGNAGGEIWKVGKSVIPQTLIASTGSFTAAATATVATGYQVDLRFFGPTPSAEAAGAFTDAAARIRAAVIGDLADVNLPLSTGNAGVNLEQCGVPGVVLNEVVDDVIIYATVTPIDGPGKILASAGPCFVRLASGASCVPPVPQCSSFTIVGVMRFDVDDVNNLISTNRLGGVVLHEMMHVVGVGTLWSPKSLLSGKGGTDPRFVGQLGVSGCSEAGGVQTCATGIPVENSGGAGTADSHWRESTFDTELMTGFAEATGVPVPMSNMTIQSLADEGYNVNSQAADPYTIPFGAGLHANVMAAEQPAFDEVLHPILGITAAGTIRKLIIQ